jgi:hypothetical protein
MVVGRDLMLLPSNLDPMRVRERVERGDIFEQKRFNLLQQGATMQVLILSYKATQLGPLRLGHMKDADSYC